MTNIITGGYVYDQQGTVGATLNATHQKVYQRVTEVAKTSMVAGSLTLSRTGQIPLRTISVPDLKPRWYDGIIGKLAESVSTIAAKVSRNSFLPFLRAE